MPYPRNQKSNKHMANEKNLNHKLTVSEQRKGGKISGKKRREKRKVRDILSCLLSVQAKSYGQFAETAAKIGVSDEKSVKEIFTLICLLNTTKDATLADLERLERILGEDASNGETVLSALDKVLSEVERLAE